MTCAGVAHIPRSSENCYGAARRRNSSSPAIPPRPARDETPALWKMPFRCVFTVCSLMLNDSAIYGSTSPGARATPPRSRGRSDRRPGPASPRPAGGRTRGSRRSRPRRSRRARRQAPAHAWSCRARPAALGRHDGLDLRGAETPRGRRPPRRRAGRRRATARVPHPRGLAVGVEEREVDPARRVAADVELDHLDAARIGLEHPLDAAEHELEVVDEGHARGAHPRSLAARRPNAESSYLATYPPRLPANPDGRSVNAACALSMPLRSAKQQPSKYQDRQHPHEHDHVSPPRWTGPAPPPTLGAALSRYDPAPGRPSCTRPRARRRSRPSRAAAPRRPAPSAGARNRCT